MSVAATLPQQQQRPRVSLYVGDLDPGVTSSDLFRVFSKAGRVSSVRVCSDTITGESLGYGYVNFFTPHDASRALYSLNHTDLKGKPMRIMWCERNPIRRKTDMGNLFVKNIAPSINSAGLEALFSGFGTILSCKVAIDENGRSKGFGFVQFEEVESAIAALIAMRNKMIGGKILYVGKFIKKNQRRPDLYVKDFDPTVDDHTRNKSMLAMHNGPMFHKKPLHMAMAQPREEHQRAMEDTVAKAPTDVPPATRNSALYYWITLPTTPQCLNDVVKKAVQQVTASGSDRGAAAVECCFSFH